MALNVTYWSAARNDNIARSVVGSEDVAIDATSATSGETPDNADYVSLLAGEATRFVYAPADSTPEAAATDAAIASGERVWMEAKPGYVVAGIAG